MGKGEFGRQDEGVGLSRRVFTPKSADDRLRRWEAGFAVRRGKETSS